MQPPEARAERRERVARRRPIRWAALRATFIALSFLPWAIWFATWSYVRLTDRWGAFAAAPFVAASIFASAGLGIAGVVLLLWMALRRQLDLLLLASTVLAASLFVYASLTR